GTLENATLELKDNLNIISLPNESGKSTWCYFICAMLYGVSSSDRDRAGYLADKTRYRPWSGLAMEGVMDISHDGRDITIQRISLGSSPMKKFTAVYTGTNEPVPGLNSENAGEILTGVSRNIFERSAFIGQAALRISQSP